MTDDAPTAQRLVLTIDPHWRHPQSPANLIGQVRSLILSTMGATWDGDTRWTLTAAQWHYEYAEWTDMPTEPDDRHYQRAMTRIYVYLDAPLPGQVVDALLAAAEVGRCPSYITNAHVEQPQPDRLPSWQVVR